ncbi:MULTISPECIES: DUF3040 domain-containing protein [Micrococcaceae]|uniref:DUF3040 domain-containing protein n=2 Tax=Micrococcales TaxID=85006 RepID=UPI000BB74752|nr:DUF3040 domain-containing protein [Glutamicibacter sp. BW78]PCC24295.1 hypothetical protein CIK75_13605 [Glutamicibacter sp. BW78]
MRFTSMQRLLIAAYCAMMLVGLLLLILGLFGESWWLPVIGALIAAGSGFTLSIWLREFRRQDTLKSRA